MEQFTVHSTTHHTVAMNSAYCIKFSSHEFWDIERENALFNVFSGNSYVLVNTSALKVLLMDNLGESPTISTERLSQGISHGLMHLHSYEASVPLTKPLEPFSALDQRFRRRVIETNAPYRVTEWLEQKIARLSPDLDALVGDTYTHTDPHLKNWVVTPDHEFLLIDWESSVLSVPEFDVACLLHSTISQGTPGNTLDHYKYAYNPDILHVALQYKALSGLTHLYWRYGTDAFWERIKRIHSLQNTMWSDTLVELTGRREVWHPVTFG